MLAETNANWAKLIIEELYAQGITHFSIAPGSRNTPLILAAAEHRAAEKAVHWDERGVGFHALGYGMAKKIPACVIVTTGTAVANLLPSVMEACYSRVPMLLLTADRPPELRDCGSNQTADQATIFQNFVRWQFDLPCPEEHLSDDFLREVLSYAVFQTKSAPPGPVHINCMFREPLYGKLPLKGEPLSIPKTSYYSFPPTMKAQLPFTLPKKGIILLGRLENTEGIKELAEHLQWPIFADLLSGDRSSPNAISSFDLLLKTDSLPAPEAILQFGDRFISKKLYEWLSEKKPKIYSLILDHSERHDPLHLFTHRFVTSTSSFCETVRETTSREIDASWLGFWKEKEMVAKKAQQALFEEESSFSESEIIHSLEALLPADWGLFFGNSMPIRDADNFLFAESLAGVFANRGTSGIDGNIATSVGIALGLQKPILTCIGDLAFLHDLSSLAQLEKSPYPVILLVLNNAGGGIFSFLGVAKEEQHFDTYFRVKHAHSFEKIAEQFSLPYQKVESLSNFRSAIKKSVQEGRSAIIEAVTDAKVNVSFRSLIQERLKTALQEHSLCQVT